MASVRKALTKQGRENPLGYLPYAYYFIQCWSNLRKGASVGAGVGASVGAGVGANVEPGGSGVGACVCAGIIKLLRPYERASGG